MISPWFSRFPMVFPIIFPLILVFTYASCMEKTDAWQVFLGAWNPSADSGHESTEGQVVAGVKVVSALNISKAGKDKKDMNVKKSLAHLVAGTIEPPAPLQIVAGLCLAFISFHRLFLSWQLRSPSSLKASFGTSLQIPQTTILHFNPTSERIFLCCCFINLYHALSISIHLTTYPVVNVYIPTEHHRFSMGKLTLHNHVQYVPWVNPL